MYNIKKRISNQDLFYLDQNIKVIKKKIIVKDPIYIGQNIKVIKKNKSCAKTLLYKGQNTKNFRKKG